MISTLGNTLEDLFTTPKLNVYNSTPYPFNLRLLDETLKKKIEEDPNYELWVPLTYCRYVESSKPCNDLMFMPYKHYISNKGRVVSFRDGTPKFLKPRLNGGYVIVRAQAKLKFGRNLIRLHRALASSFIPVKPELTLYHPRNLQINHKDGDKSNNELYNLEWETPSGNTKHAHRTGLASAQKGIDNSRTKPAKGEIIRGPYKGFQFILSGRKEQQALGFIQTSINKCCRGITREHKHCRWVLATEEEVRTLPNTIPLEILNNLFTMPPAPKKLPKTKEWIP